MTGRKGEGLNEQAASSATDGASQVPVAAKELDTQALAEQIARLAIQAKGLDVAVLRVLELVQYTDWFIVVSGRSDRHVKAIREHIQDALRDGGRKPLSVEGNEHNQWVLLDYGDVVVHIFYEPVREFYELERLWQDAPRLEIEDDAPAAL